MPGQPTPALSGQKPVWVAQEREHKLLETRSVHTSTAVGRQGTGQATEPDAGCGGPLAHLFDEAKKETPSTKTEVIITVGHRPKTAHKPRVAVHFSH